MSKARIIIQYKGANWRVGGSWRCASKRDCDLFERGVCDCDGCYTGWLPCDVILKAFKDVGCSYPNFGFKRIRKAKKEGAQ